MIGLSEEHHETYVVENIHGRWIVSSLYHCSALGHRHEFFYEADETAVYRDDNSGLLGEIYVVGFSDDHYAVCELLSWDIYPSEDMMKKFVPHERDFCDAFGESARTRSRRCYSRDDKHWDAKYRRVSKPKHTK